MPEIGKWLFFAGLGLAAVGAVLWLLARAGLPLGQLPGDLVWKGKSTSVHFPIVTCIVVSVVLTGLINLLMRLFR